MPAEAQPKKKYILPPDTLIVNERKHYIVDRLLGAGGMGDVYKVHLQKDPNKIYALKVEPRDADSFAARLKVETSVLDAMQAAPPSVSRLHFLKMHGKGKTDRVKFMIMDMAGYNLRDIIVRMLRRKVSPHTTIAIAHQTLDAIQALHKIGWLHRDIKMANFVVGLQPNDAIIFIVDFGTARRYVEDDGRLLRFPRAHVQTACTVIYCSVRCHNMQEQGRKDDLEVWMYMMLEIFDEHNISWMDIKHRGQILIAKQFLLDHPQELHDEKKLNVPRNFIPIIQSIAHMQFTTDVDYSLINRQLDCIVAEKKIDMSLPLDWLGKTMPPARKPPPPKEPEPKKDEKKKDDVKAPRRPNQQEMEEELVKLCDELDRPMSVAEIREHMYNRIDGLTGDLITMMDSLETAGMDEVAKEKRKEDLREMRQILIKEYERAGDKKTTDEIDALVMLKMKEMRVKKHEREKKERRERRENRRREKEEATEADDQRTREDKKRSKKKGRKTVEGKTRDDSDRDHRKASGGRKGKDDKERDGERNRKREEKKNEDPKDKTRETEKAPSKKDGPASIMH